MGVERKCGQCGTWNAEDICISCGTDLNPKRVRIQKIREVQKKKEEEGPQKLEIFLSKWKNTKNPLFKLAYWGGYSVWMVYMAVLSFIALMAAWGPG